VDKIHLYQLEYKDYSIINYILLNNFVVDNFDIDYYLFVGKKIGY